MEDVRASTPNTPLRRRNSIAKSLLVPAELSLPTKTQHASPSTSTTTSTTTSSSSSLLRSFPTVDFDFISLQTVSYTSLKDLLPSTAVQSPTSAGPAAAATPGGQSGYEISIRNRLVKQAAWAYLQPMSTSPESSGRSCIHRLWVRFSGDLPKSPIAALFRFVDRYIIRTITQAVDRLLRAIRVRSSR